AALSAGDGPPARARSLGIEASEVDGNDVSAVDQIAARLVDAVRGGGGPRFLQANTYRLTGHTAADPAAYREQRELDERLEQEPIARLRARLLALPGISAAELDADAQAAR